jgi:dihydroneopterin aldolase
MMFESYTKISLEAVRVEVRIGHFDWEREPGRRWPIDVWVDLYTSRTRWPAGSLADIIDYDRVHAHIAGWAGRPHTGFLETYAEDLLAFCFGDPRLEACRVRLAKPDIYQDAKAAVVEIMRTRQEHEIIST